MNRAEIHERIAANLREFGYPDATAQMVADTHAAMAREETEMPHGIVGMFAQRQLQEIADEGLMP